MYRSVALLLVAACSSTPAGPVDNGIEGTSNLEVTGGRIDCIWGSTCDPKHAFRLPWYESNRDLNAGVNVVRGYGDCNSDTWNGNEWVYSFNVQAPGTLSVDLEGSDEINAFVVAVENDYTCTAAGHTTTSDVVPGTYWLIVDSKEDASDTVYDLEIDFQEIADLDIGDDFEPNDTPTQATIIDLGWEESNNWYVNLTPLSRVDYYTFPLDPLGTFMFDIEHNSEIEVEIVDSEGLDVSLYSHDDGTGIELYDEEYWDTGESNISGEFTIKISLADDYEFDETGVREYVFYAGHDMP